MGRGQAQMPGGTPPRQSGAASCPHPHRRVVRCQWDPETTAPPGKEASLSPGPALASPDFSGAERGGGVEGPGAGGLAGTEAGMTPGRRAGGRGDRPERR